MNMITKDELKSMSNERLIELTKGRAVDIYKYNGSFAELCINDFLGFDSNRQNFVTRTGISIPFNTVTSIEIIDKINQ